MPEMLVDTSALIAFFVHTEQHHNVARSYVGTHPDTRWIILDTVFDEFVTWMRKKVSITSSIQIGHILREEHIYIHLSEADDTATWDYFSRYDDKLWSYTDCSILTVAHKLNVHNVFAFDAHIQQMAGLGIQCVPS